MSRVQRMDISPVHQTNGWLPPPSLPVCKQSQVLDSGADPTAKDGRCSTRKHKGCAWPFLYSYRGDTVIVNKAKATTKYQEAYDVGVALF